MVDNIKSARQFLTQLGLPHDQATLYLALTRFGSQTALELSRRTYLPRTQIYRRLQNLQSQSLVEQIVDSHTTRYQAVSPKNLEQMLKAKEFEVAQLNQLFPQVESYLNQQLSRRQPDTQVLFFRGRDGIRQMGANVLTAKSEIVGFTYLTWSSAVGEDYAQKFYQDMSEAKLTMREIYSNAYLKSKKESPSPDVPPQFTHLFESRYISPKIFNIVVQSDIYNDVISYYTWRGQEIFGIEIHNPSIVKMQKQIFEILWQLSDPELS